MGVRAGHPRPAGHVGQQPQTGLPQSNFNLFLVRYADGVSPSAGLASLQRQFGHDVLRHVPPEDVINLQNVDRLPFVLTARWWSCSASSRSATRSSSRYGAAGVTLAILKTVGFVRHQVIGVVAWQATSIGLAALVLGLPVGAAAGRWAWNTVAAEIGSASPPVVPLLALSVLVPAVLVVVNLIAGIPAWSASRCGAGAGSALRVRRAGGGSGQNARPVCTVVRMRRVPIGYRSAMPEPASAHGGQPQESVARGTGYFEELHVALVVALVVICIGLGIVGWQLHPDSNGFQPVPQNLRVLVAGSGFNGIETIHQTGDDSATLMVSAQAGRGFVPLRDTDIVLRLRGRKAQGRPRPGSVPRCTSTRRSFPPAAGRSSC